VPHRSVLPGLSLAAAAAILRLVDRAAGALPEPGTAPPSPVRPGAQVMAIIQAPCVSKNCPLGADFGSTLTDHMYEKSSELEPPYGIEP
jgi:hypothetical protein